MQQPWGLSGPEFLNIYWIALGVALVFAIIIRIRMRVSLGGKPARSLDLDELAYLAGGPLRVVEASLARLIEAEALRSNRRGAVQVVGTPTVTNPVDQAVLTDAAGYRSRTLTLLLPSAARLAPIEDVGKKLIELDLLIAPEVAKSWLRRAVVPMVLLFLIGVARWVNGIAIGAPVGWLTLQLVITGTLIALLSRGRKLQRTAKGDRVLDSARTGESTAGNSTAGSSTGGRASSPAVPLIGGAVGLVALGGLSAHPDLALRTALVAQTYSSSGSPGGASWAATSGYSCSGGSSSCSSGGSSCGGGGGGCGGGGGG